MKREKSNCYKRETLKIKEKLGNRDYSVGLDLGVGSIGLAAVALEKNREGKQYATELIFATSRIFSSSQGASERRTYRGQRNNIRHKANRLKALWKVLAEKGLMLPFSNKEVENPAELRFSEAMLKTDPYKLRLKGLSEKLELEEIGVALYHIANHRGSSSVRSFIGEEKSKDEERAEEQMGVTANIAKKYNLHSYIEVLQKFNECKIVGYRNKASRDNNILPIPTRDICISEFDILLGCQKNFYPDILTEEYIRQIKNTVFFENPKIVPESGNCPYFPNEKKLPKASFLNEERRIWEALNNIRIHMEIEENGRILSRVYALCLEERTTLFKELRQGKTLTSVAVKKLLPQYKNASSIVLQGSDKKDGKIVGFRFTELENFEYFAKLSEKEQDEYIFFFVNTPDDKILKDKLSEKFKFPQEVIEEAFKHTKIVSDYAPIGRSAMELLLPLIRDEGMSYIEAEKEAIKCGMLKSREKKEYSLLPYYGEVIPESTQALAGKAWHSAFSNQVGTKGFVKPNTNSEEEKFGRIANPVVHQTLNELRKMMNELITILGKKPVEITVELGRGLKVGQDARDKISRENSANEARNQMLFKKYCLTNNLGPKYIKYFRMLEEQNFRCPYCLKQISVSEVVNGLVDVDHIFPKEDTADSSFNNLVLAHTHCNEQSKKKKIPFTAFGGDEALWKKIIQYIDETPGMASKKWRFEMSQNEYDEFLNRQNFLSRFKSDNAYVARMACEYLLALFPADKKYTSVKTIKGSETGLIRRAWNLNGITQNLGERLLILDKDEERTVVGKDRSDARHHALDAIVGAYYTTSIKQEINSLSSNGVEPLEMMNRIPIPLFYKSDNKLSTKEQRAFFRTDIENFINNNTFISRKMNTNKNGQLLAATQYCILTSDKDNLVLVTKKLVKNITAKQFETGKEKNSDSVQYLMKGRFVIQSWVNANDRAKIELLLEHNQKVLKSILGNRTKAEERFKLENIKREQKGKKPIKYDESRIVKIASEMTGGYYYALSNNLRKKLFVQKETTLVQKGSAFDTGENFCLDLFHDENGKLCGEVIRKVNAIDSKYQTEYQKKGFSLFERLYPYDVLEVDSVDYVDGLSSKDCVRSLRVPNIDSKRTLLVIKTFTEVGNSIQVYFDSLCSSKINQKSSIYVSVLNQLNVRKVVLSDLGFVVYRSKLLKELENVENS